MLIDVQFRHPDPRMTFVLSAVGGGGAVIPQRIDEGMYLSTHWSLDQLGLPIRERWREDSPEYLDFDEYGVCDTPEQAVEKLRLKERPERFFISFVRIRKADQPSSGGWRWHKWGPYIGEHEPRCEYIHDEPEIDEVYTYHVYELKEPALTTGKGT